MLKYSKTFIAWLSIYIFLCVRRKWFGWALLLFSYAVSITVASSLSQWLKCCLCSATSTAGLFLTPELPAAEESCREEHLQKNTRDSQEKKEEAVKEKAVPRQLVYITSESWWGAYRAQHTAQLSRQSSNCLCSVSSSPGDIPDLDLCPVQRQKSAVRNHVTLGIKDCWKRPWGQPTVEF